MGGVRCVAESLAIRFTCDMEQIVNLHIERLPEGVYLATTKEIPGLVAQGRTVMETLEIARDVAKKLIEARSELSRSTGLATVGDTLDYPLIVST